MINITLFAESTAYPSSFDFKEVLQIQRSHPEWGGYSSMLLSKGYTSAKHGHDAGLNLFISFIYYYSTQHDNQNNLGTVELFEQYTI